MLYIAMEFTVTLPGEITAKPAFSSGYHQANIEKDIDKSLLYIEKTDNLNKIIIDIADEETDELKR